MITTKEAYDHLAGALQTDAGFALSWQANIAMPIFDGCKSRGIDMSHAQANILADDLMKHLFNVDRPKIKAAPGVAIEP